MPDITQVSASLDRKTDWFYTRSLLQRTTTRPIHRYGGIIL